MKQCNRIDRGDTERAIGEPVEQLASAKTGWLSNARKRHVRTIVSFFGGDPARGESRGNFLFERHQLIGTGADACPEYPRRSAFGKSADATEGNVERLDAQHRRQRRNDALCLRLTDFANESHRYMEPVGGHPTETCARRASLHAAAKLVDTLGDPFKNCGTDWDGNK